MMKKINILLLLTMISSVMLYAQHPLDGAWVGNYNATLFSTQPEKVVVNITMLNDTIITGTSHLYYNNKNHYEHYVVHGRFNPRDSILIFSEDSTIAVNLGLADNCLGTYTVNLQTSDTLLSLTGKWKDNSTAVLRCPTTGVWLNKRLPSMPSQPKKPDEKLNRYVDVQHLIELDPSERDSIKVELWDNTQVDGDEVTVYFNNVQVLTHYVLQKVPKELYISIPPGTGICDLKMVAESMGSVPPCTATMKITTRKKSYMIDLSSAMSKTGAIQFFVKE